MISVDTKKKEVLGQRGNFGLPFREAAPLGGALTNVSRTRPQARLICPWADNETVQERDLVAKG